MNLITIRTTLVKIFLSKMDKHFADICFLDIETKLIKSDKMSFLTKRRKLLLNIIHSKINFLHLNCCRILKFQIMHIVVTVHVLRKTVHC